MERHKLTVYYRSAFYFVLFCLGFGIVVPLAVSMAHMNGECLYNSHKVSDSFLMYGYQGTCLFVLSSSVVFNNILCFGMMMLGIISIADNKYLLTDFTSLAFKLNVALDLTGFGVILSSLVAQVIGLINFCKEMTEENAQIFIKCSDVVLFDMNDQPYYFFKDYSITLAAASISSVLWCGQFLFGAVILFKAERQAFATHV